MDALFYEVSRRSDGGTKVQWLKWLRTLHLRCIAITPDISANTIFENIFLSYRWCTKKCHKPTQKQWKCARTLFFNNLLATISAVHNFLWILQDRVLCECLTRDFPKDSERHKRETFSYQVHHVPINHHRNNGCWLDKSLQISINYQHPKPHFVVEVILDQGALGV